LRLKPCPKFCCSEKFCFGRDVFRIARWPLESHSTCLVFTLAHVQTCEVSVGSEAIESIPSGETVVADLVGHLDSS
jgi:hypothetical protein